MSAKPDKSPWRQFQRRKSKWRLSISFHAFDSMRSGTLALAAEEGSKSRRLIHILGLARGKSIGRPEIPPARTAPSPSHLLARRRTLAAENRTPEGKSESLLVPEVDNRAPPGCFYRAQSQSTQMTNLGFLRKARLISNVDVGPATADRRYWRLISRRNFNLRQGPDANCEGILLTNSKQGQEQPANEKPRR
jgi:hypothetical protein